MGAGAALALPLGPRPLLRRDGGGAEGDAGDDVGVQDQGAIGGSGDGGGGSGGGCPAYIVFFFVVVVVVVVIIIVVVVVSPRPWEEERQRQGGAGKREEAQARCILADPSVFFVWRRRLGRQLGHER